MSKDTCTHDFNGGEECKYCGYEMDMYDLRAYYAKNMPKVETKSEFIQVRREDLMKFKDCEYFLTKEDYQSFVKGFFIKYLG